MTTTVSRESCGSCFHATATGPNGVTPGPVDLGAPRQLYCRRYPPTILSVPQPGGIVIHHAIPIVSESDWCGEYHAVTLTPRPAPEPRPNPSGDSQ
jgi:hypothetical protein